MKTCCSCKENKPITEYNKHNGRSDGLQTICKTCKKIHYVAWSQKNKAYIQSYGKEYYLKNHERILERNRAYRLTNHEYVMNMAAKWRDKHRATIRAMSRQCTFSLPDWHVKQCLLKIKKDIAVPHELIEVKRLQILINRRIKNENSNATT